MDSDIIKEGFGKVLNTHGYGFQYSVLKLAHTLSDNNESQWIFEAAEFPVQVQSEGTRIDFILRLKQNTPIYLVAECKRANPALSDWCFARAPYIHRNRSNEPLLIECLKKDKSGSFYASACRGVYLDDTYQIALEIKSNEQGEKSGSGRGIIEESATQICRGLNGFVEFVAANKQIMSNNANAYFLPVIFTTARVWASDVNLSTADIKDGKVNLSNTNFNEKPWIYYQYHFSPGIKHSHSPIERSATIGELLDSEYIRTIAVVSASGVSEFLRRSSDSYNYLD